MLSALLFSLLLPAPPGAGTPFLGGVLDTTGRAAFLGGPSGLEAINLSTGDRLWRTQAAHRPLLVVGDRLYALTLYPDHRLTVVSLDLTARGVVRWRADITSLPRWVITREADNSSEEIESSFQTNWQLVRRTLHLEWHATVRPIAGPGKQDRGRLLIDLDNGRVESAEAALLSPRSTSELSPQLEKRAVRWKWQTGEQLLAVVQEPLVCESDTDRLHRLVLCAWDLRTGKALLSRELLRGRRPVLLCGLDGRELWLRDAVPAPDESSSASRTATHHWAVVSPLDGQLITRVPFIPGTYAATLLDNRAYCLSVGLTPRFRGHSSRRVITLHAIDLESGQVVWHRKLGEE
jgi:hypothetical protein